MGHVAVQFVGEARKDEAVGKAGGMDLLFKPLSEETVAEEDHAQIHCVRPNQATATLDQDIKALFRAEAAGGADNMGRRDGKKGLELETILRAVRPLEPFGANGIPDDGYLVFRHAGLSHLCRLSIRDANHTVHPAKIDAIQPFEQTDRK